MPTDYEELTRKNLKGVGDDTRTRQGQIDMYSDWTHFIFEILQNADDHRAKSIRFKLTEDELTIDHDGTPFTEENVKAITYFHWSTSKKDQKKTGRFGLGFKSVFCVTATPIIHSGGTAKESFEIYNLCCAKGAPRPDDLQQKMTRIRLPFNQHEPNYIDEERWLSPEEIYSKINNKLENLDMTTILFTSHLLKIEYDTPDSEGNYQRKDKAKKQVNDWLTRKRSTIMQHEEEDKVEEYLVFSRPIERHGKNEYKPVDIAFQLSPATEEEKEFIETADEKRLFALFPTEQETKMGFLINGPYRTTPNRENIESTLDNSFNAHLIKETCTLVCESLPEIRDMGLLDVRCLETLPIDIDDFTEDDRFRPMFEKVRITLKTEKLLPTENGSHVAGRNAKLARGKPLVDLLSNDQLTNLFKPGQPLEWLTTEITGDKTPELYRYLLGKRKSYHYDEFKPLASNMEIEPGTFIKKLTKPFLQEQDISWFKEFYLFMTEHRSLDDELKSKPCVLLKDGNLVTPVDEEDVPNAYFPSKGETDGYPVIDPRLVKNEEVRDYLSDLGVSKIDSISNVIKNVLPRYSPSKNISLKQYRKDLETILEAYKTDSSSRKEEILEKLRETPFLRAENAASPEKIKYQKADDVYLPSEDLRNYFSGNKNAWFLSDEMGDIGEKIKKSDLLDKIGVMEKPSVSTIDIYDAMRYHYVNGAWVKRYSSTVFDHLQNRTHWKGFTRDYDIFGLDNALGNVKNNQDLSRYIWELLLNYMRSGKIEFSGHIMGCADKKFPMNHHDLIKKEIESTVFNLLNSHAWIPNRDGDLNKPSELTLEDLPDSLEKDYTLAEEMGMKSRKVDELTDGLVKELGMNIGSDKLLEDLALIKRNRESFDKWKNSVEEPPPFPSKKPGNLERRKEKMAEKILRAPRRKTESVGRSVRTSRGGVDSKTYLRAQYTNEKKLVCQVCKKVMPFKKPDGKYYFEDVEIFTAKFFKEELNFDKELEELFLALCPECAARYKIFVKGDDDAMRELRSDISDHDESDDECEFSIEIGLEESTVRFNFAHFADIRQVLGLKDD